jgi:hypothetical protein
MWYEYQQSRTVLSTRGHFLGAMLTERTNPKSRMKMWVSTGHPFHTHPLSHPS